MRLPVTVLSAGLAAVLAVGLYFTGADHTSVIGTKHDVGTPGEVSSCETCHVPHEATGQMIWDGDPRAPGVLAGLAAGCYSCHDGTVAGGSYVFDGGRVQHPVRPGELGEDCDACHDPHAPGSSNFLLFPSGANLCQACHEHAGEGNHPLNIDVTMVGYVPKDAHWDPDAGDSSGTRLWDAAGQPGSNHIKCLTCHAAHGTDSDAMLTMERSPGNRPGSVLCQNCHPR